MKTSQVILIGTAGVVGGIVIGDIITKGAVHETLFDGFNAIKDKVTSKGSEVITDVTVEVTED